MKSLARIAGILMSADDLALVARGGILIALGVIAICIVAVSAGLALQLFELARGA